MSAAPRIVSLVPSITELVCDLGLADHLVGRTGFCIHPRDRLQRIPKVGGTKDVNLQKVRALAPTHVIVNIDENTQETAQALRAFVPHLVVTHPLAPRDNLALYRQIGHAFERERETGALCAEFEEAHAEAAAVARGFNAQRVLYLIWRDPWMTVSRDTYISRALQMVNWWTQPERSEQRYPTIALDETALGAIDLVLLSSEPYRFTSKHVSEIAAQTGKRVALIDGEMTSWYGSRAIEGMRYLPRFRAALES